MMEIDNDDHRNFFLSEELFAVHILPRLPIDALLRFKTVSKRWNSVILSPEFGRLQYKKTAFSDRKQHLLINYRYIFLSFDYAYYEGGDCMESEEEWDCSPFSNQVYALNEKKGLARFLTGFFHIWHSQITIVGSCDGLVCLVDTRSKSPALYVWNPTTHVRRQIPYHQLSRESDVWGFGYVSSTNDYNIVKICQGQAKKERQVFSLMDDQWTSSWEKLDGYDYCQLTGSGVTVDDVTYWAMQTHYDPNKDGRGLIIGFDLATKKFMKVPPPHWQDEAYYEPPLMSIREGRLCACWVRSYDKFLEVGTFKQSGGIGSWTKLFCINHGHLVDSLRNSNGNMPGITNKGRLVFHVPEETSRSTYPFYHESPRRMLILVDPQQEPPEDVHRLKIPWTTNMVNYIQTLISPYEPNQVKKGRLGYMK